MRECEPISVMSHYGCGLDCALRLPPITPDSPSPTWLALLVWTSVDLIVRELPGARTSMQCAMCHLLTALVAFSFATHEAVAEAGLVPQMVSLCRITNRDGTRVRERERVGGREVTAVLIHDHDGGKESGVKRGRSLAACPTIDPHVLLMVCIRTDRSCPTLAHTCPDQRKVDDTAEMYSKLEGRAAAVLRNLAHDPRQHPLLIQSGAVDVLASIMRRNKVATYRGQRGGRS